MHRILIAEDEDVLRRNLTFILNSSGYLASSARNSLDAISLLKKKTYDIVITDLIMPDKGGGELIKYVSENCPDTYIIIMTAYPSIDSAINAVKRGIIDYFTKPFKTEDILAAIEKALERKKGTSLIWEKLKSFGVTAREEDILKTMINDEITENKEIASRYSIKESTVKQHLENLYGKFGVHNRSSLISAVFKALRK